MKRPFVLLALAPSMALAFACGQPAAPTTPAVVTATAPPTMSASPVATAVASPVAEDLADAGAVTMVDAGAPAVVAPSEPVCQLQEPQSFLIRGNYIPKWDAPSDVKKAAAVNHQRAIRYRSEQYGYVPGFGKPDMNPHGPTHYVVDTTFMSLPVKMHQRVVPALKCVEAAIKKECSSAPYTPRALAGIRYKNTFRGGEITNHMYGIAIDIDPSLNSCCGCVKPWSEDPRCFKQSSSEYDKMAMPECWVHVFEKYGFYWLGHDVLRDTMHFDFLGDPDKIMSK